MSPFSSSSSFPIFFSHLSHFPTPSFLPSCTSPFFLLSLSLVASLPPLLYSLSSFSPLSLSLSRVSSLPQSTAVSSSIFFPLLCILFPYSSSCSLSFIPSLIPFPPPLLFFFNLNVLPCLPLSFRPLFPSLPYFSSSFLLPSLPSFPVCHIFSSLQCPLLPSLTSFHNPFFPPFYSCHYRVASPNVPSVCTMAYSAAASHSLAYSSVLFVMFSAGFSFLFMLRSEGVCRVFRKFQRRCIGS